MSDYGPQKQPSSLPKIMAETKQVQSAIGDELKKLRIIAENLMSKNRSVFFIGEPSGDGGCFCWDRVDTRGRTLSADFNVEPMLCPEDSRVYPNDVLDFLKCEYGKRYKFTISVSEVSDGRCKT